MRQRLGAKKVKQLRLQTGLDIAYVLVRGNTGHRKDLYLADGSMRYLWPDGTVEETTYRWEPYETVSR